MLVRGEAGVGKTRFAAELLARAGRPSLTGRADEFDRGIPYAVFRDLLRRAESGDERVHALREGLDASAAGAPADAHLRLVFGRAVEAFHALTAGSPTVLLIEDAHLADPDSLALLALLARLGDLPLLTIVTLRPSSAAPVCDLERLIERMADDGQGAVLEIEPLDRDGVRELVRAVTGAAPDDRLVDTVARQSGGNPFFAGESLRALPIGVEGGIARLTGDAQAGPRGASLRARVLGSDAAAAELAKVVSAFGRFDLRHLPLAARLTDTTEAEVSATFDRLVAEHLLVRGGEGGYELPTASSATRSTRRSGRPSGGGCTARSPTSSRTLAAPARCSTSPRSRPTSPSRPIPATSAP